MITNRPIAPNKGKSYPAEPLTPAEVGSIIAECSPKAATGIRNRALLTLAYRSGLRISELLSLRPGDVNLTKHTVRLLDTKSGKPQTRGFHPSATDALVRWMDTRKAYGFKPGTPLFCTLEGKPVHPQYARDLLHRLGKRAGIEKRCHPHGLRHAYADELRRAGVDVVTISKLLGHSSIAVTARYLDHLSNADAIATLEAVELPELGL